MLLQDAYVKLRKWMDVMERSCYELLGEKGMRGCLKLRPHSKSVLCNKECVPDDDAMV